MKGRAPPWRGGYVAASGEPTITMEAGIVGLPNQVARNGVAWAKKPWTPPVQLAQARG